METRCGTDKTSAGIVLALRSNTAANPSGGVARHEGRTATRMDIGFDGNCGYRYTNQERETERKTKESSGTKINTKTGHDSIEERKSPTFSVYFPSTAGTPGIEKHNDRCLPAPLYLCIFSAQTGNRHNRVEATFRNREKKGG